VLAVTSLRPPRPTDLDAIFRLLSAAGNFNAAEREVGVEVAQAALARPGEDYHLVVAEDGGAVTGYACWGKASLSDGTWDLYWIAVDPAARGRGIGRALLEHCESAVRQAGGRSLLAETSSRPGYEGTLEFYRAAGYETLARFRDFYSAGDDKVVFGKYFTL
jgi:ribosomal protein S18 acetylase RimI-like enzyme